MPPLRPKIRPGPTLNPFLRHLAAKYAKATAPVWLFGEADTRRISIACPPAERQNPIRFLWKKSARHSKKLWISTLKAAQKWAPPPISPIPDTSRFAFLQTCTPNWLFRRKPAAAASTAGLHPLYAERLKEIPQFNSATRTLHVRSLYAFCRAWPCMH